MKRSDEWIPLRRLCSLFSDGCNEIVTLAEVVKPCALFSERASDAANIVKLDSPEEHYFISSGSPSLEIGPNVQTP
jgi:hypothetical protein